MLKFHEMWPRQQPYYEVLIPFLIIASGLVDTEVDYKVNIK